MAGKEIRKKDKKMSSGMIVFLLLLVIVLAVAPLLLLPDGEFEGADGEAEEAILEINRDYEPWYEPLFEPKSGEVESLLFALQAAIGSGIIFYGLGYLKGKQKKEKAA